MPYGLTGSINSNFVIAPSEYNYYTPLKDDLITSPQNACLMHQIDRNAWLYLILALYPVKLADQFKNHVNQVASY